MIKNKNREHRLAFAVLRDVVSFWLTTLQWLNPPKKKKNSE
jgi:hypothetical protein